MERTIKETYRRFVGQVINNGDVDSIVDYVAEDVIDSGHAGFGSGRKAMAAFISGLHEGFPNIHMAVQWMVEENDRLAVFAPITGKHEGTFLGVKRSNRDITFNTCGFFRFDQEMIVEHQGFIDLMAIADALGVAQPPPWG